jgi:ribosomal-protein-alanine N-acetyltransferase
MADVNSFCFTPFPELNTERLLLRKIQWSDQNLLFKIHTDIINRKYIATPPPQDIQDTRKFITKILNGMEKDEWVYWVISLKNKVDLIGTICLWGFSEDKYTAELGYELLPEYQRKGLMSEAYKSIEEFAFSNINLEALEAYTHVKNSASSRLLEKFNYTLNQKKSHYHNLTTGDKMNIYFLQNKLTHKDN